jgi:gliding motility-associated-like protein
MHGDDVNLYEMLIFDRWGNKVFETKDQSISWNGTYMNNGKEAEQGAYNWRFVYRSKSNPVITNMTGSVVLLR